MPGPFALLRALSAAAELDDAAAIALGGSVRGQGRELLHGFAFFRNAQTRFAAGFGLAVEGLRHRRRAADGTHAQDIDLKAAGIVFNLQAVAGADIACGLGAEAIRFDPAQIAGSRGHGAGLEETRSPEPFVDAYPVHCAILCGQPQAGEVNRIRKSGSGSSATDAGRFSLTLGKNDTIR